MGSTVSKTLVTWMAGMLGQLPHDAETSSPHLVPRTWAEIERHQEQAAIWVRNALVEATAISGPPCV